MTNQSHNLFLIKRKQGEVIVQRVSLDADAQKAVAVVLAEGFEEFWPLKCQKIQFEATYEVEEDEIFEVKIKLPRYYADILENPQAADVVKPNKLDLNNVVGICAVQLPTTNQKAKLIFQTMSKHQALRAANTFFLSNDVFVPGKDPGLIVDSRVTAVYQDDSLFFRSFFSAGRLLELGEFFKEATDAEVEAFGKTYKLWRCKDIEALKQNATRPVRKKIAMIAKASLDKLTLEKILKVAQDFSLTLELEGSGKNRRIVVPDDMKSLRLFIRLLADDLLESPLSDERFVVNSKRKA